MTALHSHWPGDPCERGCPPVNEGAHVITSVSAAFVGFPVLPCGPCGGSRPFSEGRCLACGSETA